MNTIETCMWILDRGIDWAVGLSFINACYDLLGIDMSLYISTVLSWIWGFCIISSIKFQARWNTL